MKKILLRTGQISKSLKKEDEEHIKQRAENVRYWLGHFAPDMVKFEVKKNMPNVKLTVEQKKFLSSLVVTLYFSFMGGRKHSQCNP